PQLQVTWDLVAPRVARTFVSVRADQSDDPLRARLPQIVDAPDVGGPIAGILAALDTDPAAAWLVVACDLPLLDGATLDQLLAARDPARLATAFRSHGDRLPEPLCAIWEPGSRPAILAWVASGQHCPRRFLINHDTALLELEHSHALDNANTPDEHAAARRVLAAAGTA
ncbi:MAG: hypothetical protein EPO25_09765, partial [Gammaproteobacteria bacterium]